MPTPTWIHTVAAAAETGWLDQMVAPALTRCWTQPGDEPAAGVRTPPGRPRGIDAWACRSPSKIHRAPNAMRRTRRAGGSGEAHWRGAGNSKSPDAAHLSLI